jgi:CheY-like chemotaxis protein
MKPRVLVVEDDHDTCVALRDVLENDGCEVVTVEALHEALEALAADPRVDLVLLDLVLPDERELPAIHALRAATPAPVVAMTALPRERVPRSLPVEAVLFKPFPAKAVEEFVRRYRAAREAPETSAAAR